MMEKSRRKRNLARLVKSVEDELNARLHKISTIGKSAKTESHYRKLADEILEIKQYDYFLGNNTGVLKLYELADMIENYFKGKSCS